MAKRLPKLPKSLKVERRGAVAIVTLARPEKRNALNDTTVLGLEMFFDDAARGRESRGAERGRAAFLRRPRFVRVEGAEHRGWRRALAPVAPRLRRDRVRPRAGRHRDARRGGRRRAGACRCDPHPRRRALGLLRAARGLARHLRRRRRLGAAAAPHRRLAHDGHDADRPHLSAPRKARRSGFSHYLVEPGEGLAKGIELAKRIAGNSPTTNFAIMHALPRIAEQDRASGYRDGVADRRDRAGQRRGEEAHQGVS